MPVHCTCISTWSSMWQVREQVQVLTLQLQVRVQVLWISTRVQVQVPSTTSLFLIRPTSIY